MDFGSAILSLALGTLAFNSLSSATSAEEFDPQDMPRVKAQTVRARDGLSNVWTKLQTGKDVTIAYFGGSITAGAGASDAEKTSYRALLTQWFRETFPTSKITEVNAAVGGTGSDLGAFRMQQDVLQFQPDLIFIEFAVNDTGADSVQILRGMEGIIRQAWKADPTTDLCFIYTFMTSQQDDLNRGVFHHAASTHDTLAEYYGIPAISVANPIAQMIREGKMFGTPPRRADSNAANIPTFSKDGVHPLDVAYAIYTQIITESLPALGTTRPTTTDLLKVPLKLVESPSQARPHPLKTPLMPDNWEKAKLVPLSPDMLSAGWKLLPVNEGLGQTFAHRMSAIWEARQPGEKIRFKFRGTAAKIYDLMGPDGAQVWITLDGKKSSQPVLRFDQFCSYHRLASFTIGANLAPGEHTVEIEIDVQQPDRTQVMEEESKNSGFDPHQYEGTVLRVGSLMLLGDVVEAGKVL
jgi:lysophospholipase L1-like esterase